MILNLLNEYFKNKSQDQNASDLLNMYLEGDKHNGRYPVTAFPTPGLSTFNTDSGGVVRAGIEHRGTAYFVVDNVFYKYNSSGVRTFIATLDTITGPVSIATISNQIELVDGAFVYNYNTSTLVWTRVTTAITTLNATFMAGATTLTVVSTAGMLIGDNIVIQLDSGVFFYTTIVTVSPFVISTGLPSIASSGKSVIDVPTPAYPTYLWSQDEYFVISGLNSRAVYGSGISDGLSWNALSFNSKLGDGDFVAGLMSNKRYLYVLGQYQSDIWYNSGAATFSFEPIGPGSFFNIGIAASKSLARTGTIGGSDAGSTSDQATVIFLGQNSTGGRQVVMLDQYKPVKVSNYAIDFQINNLTTVDDALGYCYTYNGHSFYVLTFPTELLTFMYDLTTGIWSELQSVVNSVDTRHISNCYVYCYGKHLVGVYNSGTISYFNDLVFQDNGAQIKRRVVSPPGFAENKKVFFDRLQIDFQRSVGNNLTVTVDISRDSGATYTSTYTGTIPASGGRVFWTRLGMTQDAFVVRLTFTANANFTVLGATAIIKTGIH